MKFRQTVEFCTLQVALVPHDELVRGDHAVVPALPLARDLLLEDAPPLVDRALVDDALARWRPLPELVRPVRERGERHDDEERTVVLLDLHLQPDQELPVMYLIACILSQIWECRKTKKTSKNVESIS